MGCAVNGPGEAGDADFGIAGGRDAGPHLRARRGAAARAAGPPRRGAVRRDRPLDRRGNAASRARPPQARPSGRRRREGRMNAVAAEEGRHRGGRCRDRRHVDPEALAPRAPGRRRRPRRRRLHAASPGREPEWHDVDSGRPNERRIDAAEARLAPLEEAAYTAHWALATDATDEHAQRGRRGADRLRGGAVRSGPPTRRGRRGRGRRRSGRAPPRRRAAPGRDRAPAPGRAARPHRRRSRPSCRAASRATAPSSAAARSPTTRSPRSCSAPPTSPSAARRGWRSAASATSIADDLLELIALRNQAAQALGHRDHYAFSLAMEELDEGWLYALLDDLERDLSGALDGREGRHRRRRARSPRPAGRRGAAAVALRRPVLPGPAAAGRGPAARRRRRRRRAAPRPARTSRRSATTSTRSSRAPTSSPRRGKDQHAFQITVVRGSDIRTLCNLEPTLRWLETLLHELGHAIYDDSVDKSLPWLLRTHSHTFTTEAVAMLHGRRARDHVFLERFAGHRARRRAARRQRRRRAPRPAGVRRLGAGDGAVRALALRRSRPGPRGDVVEPGRALPAPAPARRHRPRRLGRQDPPHRRAGLLPQLPARPDDGLAARGDAGARARRRQPRRRSRPRPASCCASGSCAPARSCAGTSTCASATGSPLTTAAFAAELASR